MNVQLETITPERAREMLALNTRNRPRNEMHVRRLASAMINGEWKINGDTIRINGTLLIDGQHRLAACIKSGVSFQSFVAYGIKDDAFDTIDCGKRRSAADALSIMGEKYCTRIASALVMLEKYKQKKMGCFFKPSSTEIIEYLNKYPDIRKSTEKVHTLKGILPPSVAVSCHYLFSKISTIEADTFFEKLIGGALLQEEDPVFKLRERLISSAKSKGRISAEYLMALVIKTWNTSRSGKTLRTLRMREVGESAESFPEVT